jgi:hypothetical protein
MRPIVFLLFFGLAFRTAAQSLPDSTPQFQLSGYAELYYSYDAGQPADHNRPSFLYSFNRHNEVNINLGFLKGSYAGDRLRANLALMAGTYSNANLAAETGVLQNIFEANVGIKLSRRSDLWVDAGIFGSHIGFESAIGKDCWTLTRSLMADNSPYYEAGIRVGYTTPNGEWYIAGLLLNGWQRITRPEGNQLPAFGHQLTWRPSARLTLNSSSFIGNDKPEEARQMRYFHNFFAQWQISDAFGLTAGLDAGMEQAAPGSDDYATWYSPVIIARYALSPTLTVAVRGEYYADPDGVIVTAALPAEFRTTGYSANLDVRISPQAVWRIEVRGFQATEDIFLRDGTPSSANLAFTSSLAVAF